MHWLATLLSRSIKSFNDLVASFISIKRLEVVDLFDIKKEKGESLKSYLARFDNATVRVNDPDKKFFIKAFQKGLKVGQFSDSLALIWPVRAEARNSWRSEKGSKAPGPVLAKGLPLELHPLEREETANTA
ncbi:hypothetical protein CR513_22929, partial [Mucuna pruriens]